MKPINNKVLKTLEQMIKERGYSLKLINVNINDDIESVDEFALSPDSLTYNVKNNNGSIYITQSLIPIRAKFSEKRKDKICRYNGIYSIENLLDMYEICVNLEINYRSSRYDSEIEIEITEDGQIETNCATFMNASGYEETFNRLLDIFEGKTSQV